MEYEKLVKQVGPDWAELMKGFMVDSAEPAPYSKISTFLTTAKDNNEAFYPAGKEVFNAFRATPLDKVRVVILGQDPYPKAGFANGLAFATNASSIPPSLVQLYGGLEADTGLGEGLERKRDGDLMKWASQGVLLLNTALTVKADTAGSHAEIWAPFTENLIRELNAVKRDLVWIPMGAVARGFTDKVNPFRSFVYPCEHPSAGARRVSKGGEPWKHNNVFSKANFAIRLNNLGDPIKW